MRESNFLKISEEALEEYSARGFNIRGFSSVGLQKTYLMYKAAEKEITVTMAMLAHMEVILFSLPLGKTEATRILHISGDHGWPVQS